MKRNSSKPKRRYGDAGFTLVELVVVIAVLAILAGIGVVAYNGYIEKAREAADLELLGAVNTAFASACAEKGVAGLPPQGEAKLEDGKVDSVKYGLEAEADTDLTAAFMQYYEGNEDKGFNYYKSLGYNPSLGGFYGTLGDGTIILANGWKIKAEAGEEGYTNYTVTDDDGNEYVFTVKDSSVAALNESVYGIMGAAKVVSEVGACADGASYTLGQISPNMVLEPDLQTKFAKYCSENGVTKPSPEYNAAIANFFVMDVATLSKDLTTQQAIDVIKGNKSLGTVTLANKATQAATAYGVLTAWAHDPAHKDDVIYGSYTAETLWNHLSEGLKSGDESQLGTIRTEVLGLASKMSSCSGFDTFVNSTNGQNAIDAYIGALGTLYDNTSTLDDFDVYAKGFNDDDLGAILSGVYGAGSGG